MTDKLGQYIGFLKAKIAERNDKGAERAVRIFEALLAELLPPAPGTEKAVPDADLDAVQAIFDRFKHLPVDEITTKRMIAEAIEKGREVSRPDIETITRSFVLSQRERSRHGDGRSQIHQDKARQIVVEVLSLAGIINGDPELE